MEALHDQPEWCRVALASIGDAVITTDTEGQVTFLNAVAESLTGWTRRVLAYLAGSLLLIIAGGLRPSVAFSITPTVG